MFFIYLFFLQIRVAGEEQLQEGRAVDGQVQHNIRGGGAQRVHERDSRRGYRGDSMQGVPQPVHLQFRAVAVRTFRRQLRISAVQLHR